MQNPAQWLPEQELPYKTLTYDLDQSLSYPDDVISIPVLVVAYYPLNQYKSIDIATTGDVFGPLYWLKHHVQQTTEQLIGTLELGSIFRGYKNPQAQPSLRYQVVEKIEFSDPLPVLSQAGYPALTDYSAIMERINVQQWVEEKGVKEIWLWGYHGDVLQLWTSNMASQHGNISHSNPRLTHLPILSKTYTVYHYNYQRGLTEALFNHTAQIEAILGMVDRYLFWEKFAGKPQEGRCGRSAIPVNGHYTFDWANLQAVWSDIEDWTPAGTGEKRLINAHRWNKDAVTWLIYWMQSLPGRNNDLTYRGKALTNWWHFIGDLDDAIAREMLLVES